MENFKANMKSMRDSLNQLQQQIHGSKKGEPTKEPIHNVGSFNFGPTLNHQDDDHVNEVSH